MFLLIIFYIVSNAGFSWQGNVTQGTTIFEQLINANTFVDKTTIVKKIWRTKHTVMMVTAPKGFGKTVNMEIVKAFFENTVDRNGIRVDLEKTKNYKLFARTRVKKDVTFFTEHFGQHPVIHIDLKCIVYSNYNTFIKSFKRLIMQVFQIHDYLLNSKNLDEEEKDYFTEYSDKDEAEFLEDYEIHDSLFTLSYLLYFHFNRTKCIILIDGYDSLVHHILFNDGSTKDAFPMFNFTYTFLHFSLKTNKYLEKALINSCLMTGPDPAPEYIQWFPFLGRHLLSSMYGFSEADVRIVLRKRRMLAKLKDMKLWYGGYRSVGSTRTVYNPFSVIQYVEKKKPLGYWIESEDVGKAMGAFSLGEIQDKLYSFYLNKTIKTKYTSSLNPTNIVRLKELLDFSHDTDMNKTDVSLVFKLLIDFGFFIVTSAKPKRNEIFLNFPNEEISQFIHSKVTFSYFSEALRGKDKSC